MLKRIKAFQKKVSSRTPLQGKIALCFVLLTLLMAGLLWLFEIVLLERVYYSTRIRETEEIADMLIDSFENDAPDKFRQKLTNAAVSNQVCISLYDSRNRVPYYRDVMGNNCLLHGHNSMVLQFVEALDQSEDGTIRLKVFDEKIGMETLVVGRILGTKDNVQGCIFLNTILEPVGTTIHIQKRFILLLSLVLLLVGFIMALGLSNRLAVPITKITESAKRMAHGDYQTRFEGGSCREVDELARALTDAEREISRADSMQRDLVANVSHDLRTPLTMLKAYAEMIRDLSGDNPVKRNMHLQVIIDETDRLTALVNDILDLSKLENGSQKLELQTIDAASWLADIITRYKGVSEQMGYNIHFTPDVSCEVNCDPAKLERVVCNLINNAINYTGEDKNVYVRQVNTDEGVRIEVRDTGDGIEEDKIRKIFDKYYRSENHKREVVGTGLGLSIVKAILKLHNYTFGVQSKLGEGSVFWFVIRKS